MCFNVCAVTHALVHVSSILCKMLSGPLTAHQVSAPSVQPFPRYKKGDAYVQVCPSLPFVKSLANGPLTTYQISAQSVQPLPRYGEEDTSARAHVCTCWCTPPMTCITCIAAWSLNTYHIWSLSAEPFLSYSLAANFDTLHAVRSICDGDPPNEPNPFSTTSIE